MFIQDSMHIIKPVGWWEITYILFDSFLPSYFHILLESPTSTLSYILEPITFQTFLMEGQQDYQNMAHSPFYRSSSRIICMKVWISQKLIYVFYGSKLLMDWTPTWHQLWLTEQFRFMLLAVKTFTGFKTSL